MGQQLYCQYGLQIINNKNLHNLVSTYCCQLFLASLLVVMVHVLLMFFRYSNLKIKRVLKKLFLYCYQLLYITQSTGATPATNQSKRRFLKLRIYESAGLTLTVPMYQRIVQATANLQVLHLDFYRRKRTCFENSHAS